MHNRFSGGQMRIIAGMATIPERAHMVRRTVDSIVGQVDALHIGFNGYDAVPAWTKSLPWYTKKIVPHLTSNDVLGDAAKFSGLTDTYDYYLSIDDDLIYPPGYAHFMASWCHTLSHHTVSLHGSTFKSFPIQSYFQDREGVSCLHPFLNVARVQFPGTGVMCVHKSFNLHIEEFEAPNMADVWMGLAARRRGVPVFALPHAGTYLTYQDIPQEETLWWRYRRDDAFHVEVINKAFASTFVVVAGMKRTASTWMANAVRFIVERAGYTAWMGEAFAPGLHNVDVEIAKIHPFKQETADAADLIFTSERPMDQVSASFARFTGAPPSDSLVLTWRRWLASWNEQAAYCMPFESTRAPRAAVERIRAELSAHLPRCAGVTTDVVLSDLDALRPPTDRDYDPETCLFRNHITTPEVVL